MSGAPRLSATAALSLSTSTIQGRAPGGRSSTCAATASGLRPAHVEGYPRQEWILLDYGDFVVHVMTPKSRAFYDLERLWGGSLRLEVTG